MTEGSIYAARTTFIWDGLEKWRTPRTGRIYAALAGGESGECEKIGNNDEGEHIRTSKG